MKDCGEFLSTAKDLYALDQQKKAVTLVCIYQTKGTASYIKNRYLFSFSL